MFSFFGILFFRSTWHLQRSATDCWPLLLFSVSRPFSHIVRFVLLLLKRFYLTSLHLVSHLGYCLLLNFNLLFNLDSVFSCLSRQPSILALLHCVDDFQYPCLPRHRPNSLFETLFSSYVSACSWHCSFCSFDSHLQMGMLFSPARWLCSSACLLAMLCCLLLAMLSEILVDLLLVVVVQVLRHRAPFRQSGFASFVDFFFITGSSGCDACCLCSLSSGVASSSTTLWLFTAPKFALKHLQRHYSRLRHFVIIGSR